MNRPWTDAQLRFVYRFSWLLLFLAAGLVLAYHRHIFSGLQLMSADPYDTRFNNYVLEHNYRWARGMHGHGELWSPPFFYPQTGTAAYSDSLLSLLPFYAPWRLSGLAPDTSLQLMGFLLAALNFTTSYLFLSRCSGTGVLPSCAGAFLFSFASSRNEQLGHLQLIPHFYTIGALFALSRIFESGDEARIGERRRWVWVFGACLVAQVYAGFYYAWFLGFGLLTAAVWALARPCWRRPMLERLHQLRIPLLATGATSVVALIPLTAQYLAAVRMLGTRDFQTVRQMLPRLQSWLDHGPDSWLYGWTQTLGPIERLPFEWEQRLGIGILTSALVVFGWWRARQRAFVQILFLTTLTVVLLAIRWPGDWTLWWPIYEVLPGASAIRAVARISLPALIVAAVGFAMACEEIGRSRARLLVPFVIVISILEQGHTYPVYAKHSIREETQILADRIPDDCPVFYFSPIQDTDVDAHGKALRGHLDAMWAGLGTGIPTCNGYSGNLPPDWPLFDDVINAPAKEEALRELLSRWMATKNLPEVCWVKILRADPTVYSVERVSL